MGYIDPNLFGILSQVGLAIVLVVGVIFTFFRSFILGLFGFSRKSRSSQETGKDNEDRK